MFDVSSWVNFIKESIRKKNFNPWDIDLAKVADAYLEMIRLYKKFDIKLSADIILVGGILLKLKSKSLYLRSFPEKISEDNFQKCTSKSKKVKSDKESKRLEKKITLDDLIKVIKKELSKSVSDKKKKTMPNSDTLDDILNEFIKDDKDIEKKLNFIYDLLLKENIFNFSIIFKNTKVEYFLPMIIAANEGKCEVVQKKYFEDILIKSKLGELNEKAK